MLGREIKQDGLVGKQRKTLKARLYKKLRQIPKPSITMQTVKCKSTGIFRSGNSRQQDGDDGYREGRNF